MEIASGLTLCFLIAFLLIRKLCTRKIVDIVYSWHVWTIQKRGLLGRKKILNITLCLISNGIMVFEIKRVPPELWRNKLHIIVFNRFSLKLQKIEVIPPSK